METSLFVGMWALGAVSASLIWLVIAAEAARKARAEGYYDGLRDGHRAGSRSHIRAVRPEGTRHG